MGMGFFSRALLFTTTTLAAMTMQTCAATHFVGVSDFGFFPVTLNINAGDTVVWINDDEDFPHTTTSNLGVLNPDYWNAVLVDFEDTFARTFNNPGTFTYRDQSGPGTGTIVVAEVSEPTPEIVLESPRIVDGQFLFEATGLAVGKENVLEFSTNLVDWTAMSTNLADNTSMTLTNVISPGGRVFRVHQLP